MTKQAKSETVIAVPGNTIRANSGTELKVVIPRPKCIIDCHMHIESGACAPLPLLWDKAPILDRVDRETIDTLSTRGIFGVLVSIAKGETGKVQVKSTFEIGMLAIDENAKALEPDGVIGKSSLYAVGSGNGKSRDFHSVMVAQMMDMEYAHIAGLYGQTIYHDETTPWYYYRRTSGFLPEDKGKKIELLGEDALSFSKFERQLTETVSAVKANPLQLFAMYSYAPQRWNESKKNNPDLKSVRGPWNFPFSQVATKKRAGLFLGFKMYPPLGAQPLDPRLPYLHDKDLEGD